MVIESMVFSALMFTYSVRSGDVHCRRSSSVHSICMADGHHDCVDPVHHPPLSLISLDFQEIL